MEKFKDFVKKHKKKLLIAGGVVMAGVVFYFTGKNEGVQRTLFKAQEGVVNALKETDLQIPEVGKELGVYEYFQEEPFLRGMFVETYAWKLGDLGNMLINQCDANPDCPINVVLEYVSNE